MQDRDTAEHPIPADAVGRRRCAETECARPLAYAATLYAGTCGEIRKISGAR